MKITQVSSEFFSGPAVLDEDRLTITIKSTYSNFPLDTIFTIEGIEYKFISSSQSLYIDNILIIKVEKLL